MPRRRVSVIFVLAVMPDVYVRLEGAVDFPEGCPVPTQQRLINTAGERLGAAMGLAFVRWEDSL